MSKVNIIIPIYNSEEYLDEFFCSIINQDFDDFNLYVVNDCSTDNSKAKILKYKSILGGKLIYIENSTNLMLSGARNVGLDFSDISPSEYVIFLDPDDWIDYDFLSSLVTKADREQLDITICGMERFDDETGKRICLEMVDFPDRIITAPHEYSDFAYINPSVCNKLFRYHVIKGIRFRNILRSEDTCYFFEILPNANRIGFTNLPKYHYRIRSSSLSGAVDKRKIISMYSEFEKMYLLFDNEPYCCFREMFETQIFLRIACGGVCRAAFLDMNNLKNLISDTYDYLNRVIPNWRKNKYLCFGGHRAKNIKQFSVKVCSFLYKIHMYSVFVWMYYFFSQRLKRDFRI